MAPVINGRNFYNNMFNTGVMKKLIPHTPTDMAATLALISTTTKDAVNCYYYTTQSLHNEKIPEEKRKFVAGLDLSNGILNVVVQFALGSAMNTVSSKLFEKWFGKSFNEAAGKKLHKTLEKAKFDYTEKQVIDSLAKNKKYASAGFKVIAVLLVTQVIAKRIITPLLATPMAGVFKEQLEKREKAQAALHPEKKNDVKTAKAEKEEDDDDDDDEVKEVSDVKESQVTETSKDSKVMDEKVFNTFNDLAHKDVKFAKK